MNKEPYSLLKFRTTLTHEVWKRLEARQREMSIGGTMTHRDVIEDAINHWLKEGKNLPYVPSHPVEHAGQRSLRTHQIDVELEGECAAWLRRNYHLHVKANGKKKKFHKNHLLNSLILQTYPGSQPVKKPVRPVNKVKAFASRLRPAVKKKPVESPRLSADEVIARLGGKELTRMIQSWLPSTPAS